MRPFSETRGESRALTVAGGSGVSRLAPVERSRLGELEQVVERGLRTFVEVGNALREIRDSRLYRETHATFEDYCRERWGWSRRHANRQIEAADVAVALGPTGPIPPNERQARELVPLLRDEGEQAIVEVYRELREQYPDTITAINIRRVVENRCQRVERHRARADRVASNGNGDAVFGDVRVLAGDFRRALAGLSGTVDAIITDPPYDRSWLRRDGADFAAAARRMLRPTGTLVVMSGQLAQYALKPLLDEHVRHRWTAIYLLPGSHARMFVPRVATGWKPLLIYTRDDAPEPEFLLTDVLVSDEADKSHHRWGQSESGTTRIVEAFSRPSDLVVDPFLGGGTTAVVCQKLGRRFVGCDVDPGAVAVTKGRLLDAESAA
jgi:site-specific DNA-methyltransferase (adenine-specific)